MPRKKSSSNEKSLLQTAKNSNATFVSKKFPELNGKRILATRVDLETGHRVALVDLLDGSYEFYCEISEVKFDN